MFIRFLKRSISTCASKITGAVLCLDEGSLPCFQGKEATVSLPWGDLSPLQNAVCTPVSWLHQQGQDWDWAVREPKSKSGKSIHQSIFRALLIHIQCSSLRTSKHQSFLSKPHFRIQAPRAWLHSESENILAIVSLMEVQILFPCPAIVQLSSVSSGIKEEDLCIQLFWFCF